MKRICTFLIMLIFAGVAYGNPIILAEKNNGKWSNNSDWDLNRIPINNDVIIIPAGLTFIVDENYQLDDVLIMVFGTLKFSNGKLRMDDLSKVIVEIGGRIAGGGNNDQIVIGNTFKYKGSDPDVTGYSYADNSTGSGFVFVTLLPVTFAAFTADRAGDDVQLEWVTSKEMNNSHFEIERSADGKNWNRIGNVSGAITSDLQHIYHYTDRNDSNTSLYYRICQVDIDGHLSYSAVKKVMNGSEERSQRIYVSGNTVNIEFTKTLQHNVTLRIVDINGRLVGQKTFPHASHKISLTIGKQATGVLIVQTSDNMGWSAVKKIIM